MSDKTGATRARQACEPCRRKKTKCPGEKPVCSFCQRLGQRCSYEKGDVVAAAATTRVTKSRRSSSRDSSGSKNRLHRLETRVEEVFDILSSFAKQNGTLPSSTRDTQLSRAPEQPRRRPSTSPQASLSSTPSATQDSQFEQHQGVEPPEEVWAALVEVYRRRFDSQPLSVLSPHTLATPPKRWPAHLRWSFMSLTVPFLHNDTFFAGHVNEAVTYYTTSARHEIYRSIAEGQITLPLLQALCLSAQREILSSNSLGAWTNISNGIRLALATSVMSSKQDPKIALDSAERSRCCWSLFALDRFYGSTLTIPPALSIEEVLPEYPQGTPCPRPSNVGPKEALMVKDLGVTTYYLQLLSIWGDAMRYVQSVRDGATEDPWVRKSQYHEINARLYDFETKFAQVHRFQQARFADHDLGVLEKQRSYWAQWLSGQFMFHAVQGLINHPFLHIASRSRRQGFQPPSFQQHSIDQVVLHSRWILKCIEVCSETGFKIHDPFMAHLVALTATIYLFLLNAKDDDLATQARLGFESCYSFIRHMSRDWPHLQHTVEKLNILQGAAIPNSAMPSNPSGPKAQRSLLWELLDYSASTMPSQVPEFASDAVDLNVDTRFLSPLNPLSTGHTPAGMVHKDQPQPSQVPNQQPIVEALWDPAMDALGFNLFDNEHMADLTNLTFGRDLWTFGQL